MAESVTLFKYSGRYYTADGWVDYLADGHTGTPTEVQATREKVTVSLMDGNAGTLYYDHGSAGGVTSYSRTDPNGENRKRYTNDGATSTLEYWLYFVSGAVVICYGAHPAHPGFWRWYTGPGGSVNYLPANAARYSFNGSFVHEAGNYEERVSNIQSGTERVAGKIVYNNSTDQTWFDPSVAKGKSYAIYAGYYWFAMISTTGFTPDPTPNSNTRTVSSSKKRALVSHVDAYNASTESATVKQSDGNLTFVYWHVLRQNCGAYETNTSARTFRNVISTDGTTGVAVVLRALWTGAGKTGTRYANGSIISEILTRRPSLSSYDTRVALYCEWVHRFSVSLDAQGGSQTTSIAYWAFEESILFADETLETRLDRVVPPTKTNGIFLGYYTEATGGDLAVNASGEFLNDFAATEDTTLYAHWKVVVEVEIDKQGGTGGTSRLAYDSELPGYVADGGDEAVTSVVPPERPQYSFLGYYTQDDVQCVTAAGEMTDYFIALAGDAPSTVYAHWQRISYRMDLEDASGAVVTAIYCNGSDATFHRAPDLTDEPVDAIELPDLPGYAFNGYVHDGVSVIDENGDIICGAFAEDIVATADVTANVYEITFNYAGGSGAQESKSVTYGQPIGTLPTVTPPPMAGYAFNGWLLNGSKVTADTVYEYAYDVTLTADISTPFETITDYFRLGGPLLVCIDSTDGAVKTVIETSHNGKLSIGAGNSSSGGAHKTYGQILNPKCTYRVIGRGDLLLILGKAYGMAELGSMVTENGVKYPTVLRSGYMLTRWVLKTAADGCPVLEVYGTGNEGYAYGSTGKSATARLTDAVNTFQSVVHLDPDHIAQDPMSAVSGGGELCSCETEGRCDPIVPTERGMPCASDVSRGKIVVHATTYAYLGESAPTTNSPFVATNIVTSHGENDFASFDLTAERSL